ncbi:hypothetical protein GMLC_22670 [Geomonas limicola]|uniref:Uncharacterized protein n=1 Tax=Geomonas limicola TaxID=2740186 RepID=A0A6V8N7Z3_9BACT|nr:hypothetical protein [Geomonas limicola]GFO68688.1 hypothetical protein GMLC_22670 [Geomonas limicola]
MPKRKISNWKRMYELAAGAYYAKKLMRGEDLTPEERHAIAELLCPEMFKPSKKAAHRPAGTTRTGDRNRRLCQQYVALYDKSGSDSAFATLAEVHGMSVAAVRKVVSGEELERAKELLMESPLRRFIRIGPPQGQQAGVGTISPDDQQEKN